jgi:hypothetical protein
LFRLAVGVRQRLFDKLIKTRLAQARLWSRYVLPYTLLARTGPRVLPLYRSRTSCSGR